MSCLNLKFSVHNRPLRWISIFLAGRSRGQGSLTTCLRTPTWQELSWCGTCDEFYLKWQDQDCWDWNWPCLRNPIFQIQTHPLVCDFVTLDQPEIGTLLNCQPLTVSQHHWVPGSSTKAGHLLTHFQTHRCLMSPGMSHYTLGLGCGKWQNLPELWEWGDFTRTDTHFLNNALMVKELCTWAKQAPCCSPADDCSQHFFSASLGL